MFASLKIVHLAHKSHGDLPPPAGHLDLRAIYRRPLETLVTAPQERWRATAAGRTAKVGGGAEVLYLYEGFLWLKNIG